jgi:hypothetical protein
MGNTKCKSGVIAPYVMKQENIKPGDIAPRVVKANHVTTSNQKHTECRTRREVMTEAVNRQMVDGPTLLEILFPPNCRPTLRWLRDQQKAKRLPFVKIGRLVFFIPDNVRAAMARQNEG